MARSSPGIGPCGPTLPAGDSPGIDRIDAIDDGIDVSIVIPCYNQGEFILDAIASVEACESVTALAIEPGIEPRRGPKIETIIVNDGSTEALTLSVLAALRRSGYVVIDQVNQGLAAARNTAIAIAQGWAILPLDADNKIRPVYLEKGLAILATSPHVGVVHGWAEWFGGATGLWQVPEFDREAMLVQNAIDACALFRKQVWLDCGGYDPQLRCLEDWDFWLNAADWGWQFHCLPEVCFDYRVRDGSLSDWSDDPDRYWQAADRIRRKYARPTG